MASGDSFMAAGKPDGRRDWSAAPEGAHRSIGASVPSPPALGPIRFAPAGWFGEAIFPALSCCAPNHRPSRVRRGMNMLAAIGDTVYPPNLRPGLTPVTGNAGSQRIRCKIESPARRDANYLAHRGNGGYANPISLLSPFRGGTTWPTATSGPSSTSSSAPSNACNSFARTINLVYGTTSPGSRSITAWQVLAVGGTENHVHCSWSCRLIRRCRTQYGL